MKTVTSSGKLLKKLLLTLTVAICAYAKNVLPDESNPTDDLGIRFWQWVLSIPSVDNPFIMENSDGAKCGVGQNGPVWFLVGTTGGGTVVRNACDFIPAGKSLFFPLVNYAYFAFLSDPPETRTLNALRDYLSDCDMDSIRDVEVIVDGKLMQQREEKHSLIRYYGDDAEPFQIQLPTDNYFGFDSDAVPELMFSPSVQQGLYAYLRPMPPGPHTIHWTATWDCFGEPIIHDITYNLTIIPNVAGLVEE